MAGLVVLLDLLYGWIGCFARFAVWLDFMYEWIDPTRFGQIRCPSGQKLAEENSQIHLGAAAAVCRVQCAVCRYIL